MISHPAPHIQNTNLRPRKGSMFTIRLCIYLVALLICRLTHISASETDIGVGIMYSIFIGVVGILEIYFARGKYFMFHPTVVCTIIVFIMGFSVSNYIYFFKVGTSSRDIIQLWLGTDGYKYIDEGLFWAAVSLLAMWCGYHQTFISNYIYNTVITKQIKKYIRTTLDFNMNIVNILYGLSVASRLFLISAGLFGFATAATGQQGAYENVSGIFALFTTGSSLGVFVYSIRYFNKSGTIVPMLLSCGLEIAFGILSGFKSGLVYPVLIIMFGYIVVYKRVNIRAAAVFALSGAFLLVTAFSIVENFRNKVLNTSDNLQGVDNLVNFTVDSNKDVSINTESGYDDMSALESTLARMNYSVYNGIAFKHIGTENADIYSAATQTTEKILLSPIYFFLPRVFWAEKPRRENGMLFYYYFAGGTFTTSISPSIIGYTAIIYSPWFLIPFFLVFGILQNVAFSFSKIGFGGLIITFSLFVALVFIDEPDFVFINMFKNFTIALIAQHYLIKK